MPSERTALYALNQAKLDAFGHAIDGRGMATHEIAAEYVGKLEEAGVLVVINIDDIADQVFLNYIEGELSVRGSTVAALEFAMERACDG